MEHDNHFRSFSDDNRSALPLANDAAEDLRDLFRAIVVTEVTAVEINWRLPIDLNKSPEEIRTMLAQPIQLWSAAEDGQQQEEIVMPPETTIIAPTPSMDEIETQGYSADWPLRKIVSGLIDRVVFLGEVVSLEQFRQVTEHMKEFETYIKHRKKRLLEEDVATRKFLKQFDETLARDTKK